MSNMLKAYLIIGIWAELDVDVLPSNVGLLFKIIKLFQGTAREKLAACFNQRKKWRGVPLEDL